MFLIQNPLLFARWLQVERGVIGEDVDIDGLFAQYDLAQDCNHDEPALREVTVLECECGTFGLTDDLACEHDSPRNLPGVPCDDCGLVV